MSIQENPATELQESTTRWLKEMNLMFLLAALTREKLCLPLKH